MQVISAMADAVGWMVMSVNIRSIISNFIWPMVLETFCKTSFL